MTIALVTARELPRDDHDLPILVDAFAARGVRAEIVAWEDSRADWARFDAAVVRSTWNYVAHYENFRAWLSATAQCTRLINPLAVLEWNLHKSYLLDLAAAGIPIAPTTLVRAGEATDWSAQFARHGELVLKPAVSAGSFATIRLAPGEVERACAHRAQHAHRDFLVQPLLDSVMRRGEVNLVHFNGQFSHAISKHARWSDDDEQSRGLVAVTAADKALAQRVLAAIAAQGLDGADRPLAYARVDMAHDEQGQPMLMEVELVEPSLYLEHAPQNAAMLVDAVLR